MRPKYLALLLKLEVSRLLKRKRSTGKKVSNLVLMIIVGVAILLYSGIFTALFIDIGKGEQIPVLFGFIVSVIVFFTGISNGSNNLFGREEFEILFPMPFKESEILFSKFMGIYLDSLFYSLAVFIIPAIVLRGPGVGGLLLNLLSILLIPVIPTFLGAFISTQVVKSLHFQNMKTLGKVLGLVILFVAYIFFISNMENFMNQALPYWERLHRGLLTYYPPLALLVRVYKGGSFTAFLGLLALDLVIGGGIFFLISKNYFKHLYQRSPSREKHEKISFKKRPLWRSLYRKELKHYLWRGNYVTNTIPNSLIILLGGLSTFLFNYKELLGKSPELEAAFGQGGLMVYILCFFAVATETTYCTFSLEGDNFESLASFPLTFWQVLLPKVLLGMTFPLIPLVLSSVLFGLALDFSFLTILGLILACLASNFFGNLVGAFYDLKTLDLDWKTDMEVIKSRFSMVFMSLASILPLALAYVLSKPLESFVNLGQVWLIFIAMVLSGLIILLLLDSQKEKWQWGK